MQGRTVIEQMLAAGDLQRVPASREHADRLLEQARRHARWLGRRLPVWRRAPSSSPPPTPTLR
ncbi:MAG TPA: hypothetical protein VIM01_14680, partial [Dermatophilaceae bacterium]